MSPGRRASSTRTRWLRAWSASRLPMSGGQVALGQRVSAPGARLLDDQPPPHPRRRADLRLVAGEGLGGAPQRRAAHPSSGGTRRRAPSRTRRRTRTSRLGRSQQVGELVDPVGLAVEQAPDRRLDGGGQDDRPVAERHPQPGAAGLVPGLRSHGRRACPSAGRPRCGRRACRGRSARAAARRAAGSGWRRSARPARSPPRRRRRAPSHSTRSATAAFTAAVASVGVVGPADREAVPERRPRRRRGRPAGAARRGRSWPGSRS